MKTPITIKEVTKQYANVFCCGYCELQTIFQYEEPSFYNAGTYGWNCDIYTDRSKSLAIITGYRNLRGKKIPSAMIRKYSELAQKIVEQSKPYVEVKAELDENREMFITELLNGGEDHE